jgi:hypothetical protein
MATESKPPLSAGVAATVTSTAAPAKETEILPPPHPTGDQKAARTEEAPRNLDQHIVKAAATEVEPPLSAGVATTVNSTAPPAKETDVLALPQTTGDQKAARTEHNVKAAATEIEPPLATEAATTVTKTAPPATETDKCARSEGEAAMEPTPTRLLVGLVAYVFGASVGVISVILLLRRRGEGALPRETIELINQSLHTWRAQIAQGKPSHILAGRVEIDEKASASRSGADGSGHRTQKSSADQSASKVVPLTIHLEKNSSGPQASNAIAHSIIMENRKLRTNTDVDPSGPSIQWLFNPTTPG